MISILLAILPVALQVLGWIFGKIGDNQKTNEAFIALIQAAKDDGLIAIEAKDEFQKQKEELQKGDDKK